MVLPPDRGCTIAFYIRISQDVRAFSVMTNVVAPTLAKFTGPISALIVAIAIRTVLVPLTHDSTVSDPTLEGRA